MRHQPGGIQSANINVGKNLSDLDVPHGIFRSWITAGVTINGVNVGADGVTGIYNSEIDAGTSITNVTVGGDVTSGFRLRLRIPPVTRRGSSRARSGQPRSGPRPTRAYTCPMDRSAISRSMEPLIDAVLAASVAPFGDNGTLPPSPPPYGTAPLTSIFGSPPQPQQLPGPWGRDDRQYDDAELLDPRQRHFGYVHGSCHWATGVVPHATVLSNGSITAKITDGVVSTQVSQTGDTYDYAGLFAYYPFGVTPPESGRDHPWCAHDAPG